MNKALYEQDFSLRSRQLVHLNDLVKYRGHTQKLIDRFHDDALRVVLVMTGEIQVVHGTDRYWLSRGEIEVIT